MSSLPRLLTGAWVLLSQFYGYSAVTLAENLQKRPNTLPKVSIVVYGRIASQGATSLSVTEPPYEVAFERIKGDFGDHFDLRYVQTSAFPCLSALLTNASLAWWYNQRQEADHTFVFITPGGSGLLCDASDASVHRYILVDVYRSCGTMQCTRDTKEKCDNLVGEYKFYWAFENRTSNRRNIWLGICSTCHTTKTPTQPTSDSAIVRGPILITVFRHVWLPTMCLCKLCEMLHAKKRVRKFYPNLEDWWVKQADCKQPQWNTFYKDML
ncbi:hypothetical protein BV898_14853 [Hypsibius exemplaris]|uniref:Uncharacterized protein n=1 Tax=Hypsibius exemplaris TaxID=2072580 RepID=A0A9X6RJV5_HYPEX|nr:hypothetical protein BV898_14853 [Hypsibius exemplaris]